MGIIGKISAPVQQLLGEFADQAAAESGVMRRKRKFTALSLARTFVVGFLRKPAAADEDLAQIAVQCGAAVTPQAVEQRQTPKLVRFLESLFRRGIQVAVGAGKALAPLLERFASVTVLDSSPITLPDRCRQEFPGCGGGRGGRDEIAD